MKNNQSYKHADHEVFISYASRDRERVQMIAHHLESAGVKIWLDLNKIPGGTNYGEEIVSAIKKCKVLMLMCSDASMRSRNVKAEIQLAWRYERPYLPLLLEKISFPEQLEYWLEGWQWVEVMSFPAETWLPRVLEALALKEVKHHDKVQPSIKPDSIVEPILLGKELDGLRAVAKFTDQIWPLPAARANRGMGVPTRGLGAPQDHVQHGFRLGSRACLAVESDRAGHLLLLDEGPEGVVYCLCPSWFAPDTRLRPGRNYLPQEGSDYDSFVITGKPGREQLLAVITDEPLELDWLPKDPEIPARVLNQADIGLLLNQLRTLEGNRWTALSTYFDVIL